jgi:hypothetical protein
LPTNLPVGVIVTVPDAVISPVNLPDITAFFTFMFDSTFPSLPIISISSDIISPITMPSISTGYGKCTLPSIFTPSEITLEELFPLLFTENIISLPPLLTCKQKYIFK